MGLGSAGYRAKAWASGCAGLALIVMIAAQAHRGYSQTEPVRALIVSSLIATSILSFSLRGRLGNEPAATEMRFVKRLKGLVTTSLGASTYRGSLYLSGRLDIILMGFLLTPDKIGVYAVALTAVDAITSLPKGLADVVLTRTRSKSEKEGDVPLDSLYARVSIATAGALIVGVAGMWIVGEYSLGQDFGALGVLGLALSAGAFSMTISRLVSYHLMGLGDSRRPIVANMGSLGAMIALDLVLIPRIGVLGAAVANSASSLLLLPLLLPPLASRLGVPWTRLLGFPLKATDDCRPGPSRAAQ